MRFIALLAAIFTCLASAADASAAPIPGATYGSFTLDPPIFLDVTGGLAPVGCPFVQQQGFTEAQTSDLAFTISGWSGPMQDVDFNPNQQVLLRARVTGSVLDAYGNTYHVSGNFLDSSIHYLFNNDLLYLGTGTLTLAGPAGVVTGEAEFHAANAPPDYFFIFTNVRVCNVR
ncbi:MAG: hypothetical protein ACXVY6_15720 [Gaiellaceae bacterium]